jgi:hypothetical protein
MATGTVNRRSQGNNKRCSNCFASRPRRPWTSDKIAQLVSNLLIVSGTVIALSFAVNAVKDVTAEYTILTIFIVGGTLFGGGCLLALVNVSWMSRRPGVRISAIQVICNVVLFLITAYLELLFWPYPYIAYSILFAAAVPMLILVNLPSCFLREVPLASVDLEGDTVCLDEDEADDATIECAHLDTTEQTEDLDASVSIPMDVEAAAPLDVDVESTLEDMLPKKESVPEQQHAMAKQAARELLREASFSPLQVNDEDSNLQIEDDDVQV